MDVWQLVLYAVASFLALRSLVSLMTHHKQQYQEQLLRQQQQKSKKKKQRKAEPQPTDAGQAGEVAA